MLRIRTFGCPAVEGSTGLVSGAASQRKSLALLALLAAAGEHGLSRDKILAYLWPEADGEKAAHRLSQVLSALRRCLQADDAFLGTSELRLNPRVITADVVEFSTALDRGDLEHAVSLYVGPFLDGFYLSAAPEFERWVDVERGRHAKRVESALESLASAATHHGDVTAAAEWWRRLAEIEPLNSRVAVRFMDALSATGDRAAALELARMYEARMREEYGAAPDPAVSAAAQRIRAQPASPSVQESPPVVAALPTPVASVAVLPFANLSGDAGEEYFSDGITEEIINALSQLEGLRVTSRASCFALKGKNIDIRDAAERLRVSAVVEGSVRRAGDRVRITAQLVSAADGYHLWSETYERTLADVFAVQEELARAIANALSAKLLAKIEAPLVKPSTDVLEAYTLYLRGRYFANQRTIGGLQAGIKYFEQAIERDPTYALAHAGLAECYGLRGFEEFGDLPALEAMPRAKASALRALEIDPTLAEAHGVRAWIATLYDWDWAGAETGFRRAIELKPTYTLAQLWYAVLLGVLERHEESLRWVLRAEALDPVSLTVHLTVARCYCFAQRYDEAIEQLRATLEMEPTHVLTYVWLARAYGAKGLLSEALAAVEEAMRFAGRLPILLSAAGVVNGFSGRHEEARRILEELRNAKKRGGLLTVYTAYEAGVCAALGDAAEAFRLLDRLYDERAGYLAFLRVSWWWWAPLRSDPRFNALLKRMRLDF